MKIFRTKGGVILNRIIKNNAPKLLLFYLVFCFSLTLSAQGGKVTLSMKNVTLEQVFDAIKNKSNYSVLIKSTNIDLNETVSVDVTEGSVEDVLKNVLRGKGLSYEVKDNHLVVFDSSSTKVNPTRVIKGRILDQHGEPLIGASVKEVGVSNGTLTNFEGNFTLNVSEKANLIVTYIGFTNYEFVVGTKANYEIVMKEDSELLSEVIVVGYGTQKKENLTGAVAQISAKEFEDRPVANVGQALQGVIPNLNVTMGSGRPGAGASFNVRGTGSPNGGSPLILVDGIETYPDRINSHDIETVTVLKDAASAAIYGARASFGVILITTKKGAKNQKAKVSYSGNFSFSKPTVSTDFETRGYYSAKVADQFLLSSNNVPYTSYTTEDYQALWDRRDDKKEHPDRPWVTTGQRNGVNSYLYLANFDWYNYLYDDSKPSTEHNISVAGGDKSLSYLLSGRFYSEDGVQRLDTDNYKSFNFRSKLSLDIKPWLTLSNNTKFFSGTYAFSGYDNEYQNWRKPSLHALASFVPVNPDGTPVSHTSMTNSSAHYIMDGYGAMMNKGLSGGKKRTTEITTQFELKAEVTKDIELKADFGYTKGYLRNDHRSVNVQYSQFPGVIDTEPVGNFPDSFREVVWDQEYFATNVYGNYKKSFSKHNIEVIGGANYEAKYFKDLSATQEELYTEEMSDLNLAYGNISELKGGKNEYAIMGVFYRATYNYDGKYLFETNGRYDGSSRFKKGDRFGFFPSFSAAYRISEEKFFTPFRDIIDNLKVRASYGSLGNQTVKDYYPAIQEVRTESLMGDYSFDGKVLGQYASITAPVSGGETWETIVHKNIGLDVNLLNSRLNIEIDGYIRDTKDILARGPSLPSIFGASTPLVNGKDIRAKGFEISVNWRDSHTLLNRPFSYSVTATLADYTAKFTKANNPTNSIGDDYKGKKVGEIWGYRIDGLFKTTEEAQKYASEVDLTRVNNDYFNSTGAYGKGIQAGDMKYLDLNGDGKVDGGAGTLADSGDREIIGNSSPRYSYGFNFSFDWYGFDVSTFFQGIGKQEWYPGADNIRFWGPYSRPYATFLPKNFMSRVWSEDNPDSYFPRARAYSSLSSGNSLYYTNDRYLQDLAYMRLKNLTVGYTLPASLVKKIRLEKCRVYFSGENLFTTTKLKNDFIDPEQASAADDKKANVYPWSSTFSFGLNVTF